MSVTGIGAAVRRKEDHRFITGTGHYTADINRPGQVFAYFVRSPHAHAAIKSIDIKAAAQMPGVRAVLTGAELPADKIGNTFYAGTGLFSNGFTAGGPAVGLYRTTDAGKHWQILDGSPTTGVQCAAP